MTMPTASAQPSANTNTSSGSSQKAESSEIVAAKTRVETSEADADNANKWLLRCLVVYLAIQFVMALVTFWAYKANKRLRASDSIVSSLYQERAAKAEADLLEVRKDQEPRRLTDNQRETIAESLRGAALEMYHAGAWKRPSDWKPIRLLYADKDIEAAGFAWEIKLAITSGGFSVVPETIEPIDLAPLVAQHSRVAGTGLWIVYGGVVPGPVPEPPPEAVFLHRAFGTVGINTTSVYQGAVGPNEVQIVVAARPITHFETALKRETEEKFRELDEWHERAKREMEEIKKANLPPKPTP